MVDRDPALLPGLTAGQWQGRAFSSLVAAIGVLIVTGATLGFGWRPHPATLLVPAVLGGAGFVAWIVLGEVAVRRMKAERAAGYSTTLDVAGVDLRDPCTGVLRRTADEPPEPVVAESLMARMLRVPRDRLPGGR